MNPLEEMLRRSGYPPGSDRARKMGIFLVLLEKWNAKVNLTASTAWSAVGPLFEEAVWAA